MKRAVCLSLLLALSMAAGLSSDPAPARQQYLCVLKLAPPLLEEKNWTERETFAVQRHFERLQRLTREGVVIMAGRTLDGTAEGMGLVVFEAGSEAEARRLMEEDDAVQAGVMTARLFPFRVALLREFFPGSGDAAPPPASEPGKDKGRK